MSTRITKKRNVQLIQKGFGVVEAIYNAICRANPGFNDYYLAEDIDIVTIRYANGANVSNLEIKFRCPPRNGAEPNYDVNTKHVFNVSIPTLKQYTEYLGIGPSGIGPLTENELDDIVNILSSTNVECTYRVPSIDECMENGVDILNAVDYRCYNITRYGNTYMVEHNGNNYSIPEPESLLLDETSNKLIYRVHKSMSAHESEMVEPLERDF